MPFGKERGFKVRRSHTARLVKSISNIFQTYLTNLSPPKPVTSAIVVGYFLSRHYFAHPKNAGTRFTIDNDLFHFTIGVFVLVVH